MYTTESDVLGLDFVNDLNPNEHLLLSNWTITVVAGVDAVPQSRLQGPSFTYTTAGSAYPTAVIQRVGNLLPGVTYAMRAEVATDFGNYKDLWSHIRGEAIA
jgi:hypothetical protein